jgi:hypothetical protein
MKRKRKEEKETAENKTSAQPLSGAKSMLDQGLNDIDDLSDLVMEYLPRYQCFVRTDFHTTLPIHNSRFLSNDVLCIDVGGSSIELATIENGICLWSSHIGVQQQPPSSYETFMSLDNFHMWYDTPPLKEGPMSVELTFPGLSRWSPLQLHCVKIHLIEYDKTYYILHLLSGRLFVHVPC